MYAIEKLPDSSLRERLSSYLKLSARQIQVWFQNRRQRAKAKVPARSTLSSSDQIMDALFEFSDSLTAEARSLPAEAKARLAAIANPHGPLGNTNGGGNASPTGSGAWSDFSSMLGGSGGGGSCATSACAAFPANDFEWGLTSSNLPSSSMLLSGGATPQQGTIGGATGHHHQDSRDAHLAPSVGGSPASDAGCAKKARQDSGPLGALGGVLGGGLFREEGVMSGLGGLDSKGVLEGGGGLGSSVNLPASPLIESILAFACHVLGLDAVDYWQMRPSSHSKVQPSLLQMYVSEGSTVNGAALACCRNMLASQLSEAAACTRANAWFGICKEQQGLLHRAGVPLQTVVSVPCQAQPLPGAGSQASIGATLVLYARPVIQQSQPLHDFLRILSATVERATALLNGPGRIERALGGVRSYAQYPVGGAATVEHAQLDRLLLVAARALEADVAEHWVARLSPEDSGVSLSAESILSSEHTLQHAGLVIATGPTSESCHPFSSQMCRASLFAGKLVWCTATHPSGVLEGVQLPMQTALGIPFRPTKDAQISVFVLYSLRRLEECTATTNLLSIVPQLAHACAQPAVASAMAESSSGAHSAAVPAPGDAISAASSSSAASIAVDALGAPGRGGGLGGGLAGGLGGGLLSQGVVVKQEGGQTITGSVKSLFGLVGNGLGGDTSGGGGLPAQSTPNLNESEGGSIHGEDGGGHLSPNDSQYLGSDEQDVASYPHGLGRNAQVEDVRTAQPPAAMRRRRPIDPCTPPTHPTHPPNPSPLGTLLAGLWSGASSEGPPQMRRGGGAPPPIPATPLTHSAISAAVGSPHTASQAAAQPSHSQAPHPPSHAHH